MDNSIRLKELQVVSGAWRKGARGFFKKSFSKWFFLGEEARIGQFHPLPNEFFLNGLGKVNFISDGD